MTMTHKILSLLLVSSLALGLSAEQETRSPKHKDTKHKEYKKDRKEKESKDTENDDDFEQEKESKDKERKEKKCKDKECPKPGDLSRTFEAQLSFDQELILVNGALVARVANLPEDEKAPKVAGRIELCFSKDLSSLEYKLFVFDAKGRENANERITLAHLHAGRSYQNGPVIVSLFELVDPQGCGKEVNGLLAKGVLTADDLVGINTGFPIVSANGHVFNSIAALFDGCRRGEVYANVHGSDCEDDKPTFENGIVRGEIFSTETTN